MSTQLILYPQNYKGYIGTMFGANEYVVDGVNFASINSLLTVQATLPTLTVIGVSVQYIEMLTNYPASIVNTWYTFRSDGGGLSGVPAYPTQAGNSLTLDGAANWSWSGVYQRFSNLITGQVYDITVNIIASGGVVGELQIRRFGGFISAQVSSQTITPTATSTTYTASFTSNPSTASGIMVIFYAKNTSSIKVENISVQEAFGTPNLTYADLQDGQVICDLYQEEDIPLTLSVDDFKNVAEQVKSYSKNFDLPATKRNNQIFNNMFEVTRANDGLIFNPYVRTKCVLKQDGFLLFEGYLRLIDVKDKEGEISYNVNLFSEVIVLAGILKDATFSEIDFTELDHTYNKDTIKDSWENVGAAQGLPLLTPLPTTSFAYDAVTGVNNTQVLKYPFIDWTHQYIVGGTNSATAGVATEGNPELTRLEQAFRPCIQLKYLINKIFAATNQFTWTSNFFDSADFEKLFMDFNWGGDNMPVPINVYDASWDEGSHPSGTALPNIGNSAWKELRLIPETEAGGIADSTVPPNYQGNPSAADPYIITATTDNEVYDISYRFVLENTNVAGTILLRWLHTTAAGVTTVIDYATPFFNTYYFYSGSLSISLQTGDTLSAQFQGTSDFKQAEGTGGFQTSKVQFVVSSSTATSIAFLSLRGELGQWDFLKGILTMFNLVSLVDESNPDNILIEPYADVFINNTVSGTTSNLTLAARSIQHDWTDKIDASQMELKPLTDLNKNTIFQFVEDDDDYIFQVFKEAQSGHLYGSLKFNAETSTNGLPTILEGTKEIIAEPFAATVSKPLMWQFASFIVPMIYSLDDDGTTEGFDNSPRIFYNNGIKDTGASYYIPEQNGVAYENEDEFLQFSHLSDIPTVVSSPPAITDTRDFVFASSQLIVMLGSPPVDNLFQTYWLPYFNELYNADTRIMTLKVNLSPSDVASFKFYDTVFIKNRVFRVNKIEYKPNSLAKVEFILIP